MKKDDKILLAQMWVDNGKPCCKMNFRGKGVPKLPMDNETAKILLGTSFYHQFFKLSMTEFKGKNTLLFRFDHVNIIRDMIKAMQNG